MTDDVAKSLYYKGSKAYQMITMLFGDDVYLDNNQPIEKRVEDALARMILEEKAVMTHAQSKFSSPGVLRLGIPENWMSDGSTMYVKNCFGINGI